MTARTGKGRQGEAQTEGGQQTVQGLLAGVVLGTDGSLHIRPADPGLGGELRDPDRPDDLPQRLLNGEPLVNGGPEEGAGKCGAPQPLGEIDVPVHATPCHVPPPDP